MRHLSGIRCCNTNKALLNIFTAQIVPYLGAHYGNAIFRRSVAEEGHRYNGARETREYQKMWSNLTN